MAKKRQSAGGRPTNAKAHLSFPDIRKLNLQFRAWRPEPPYMQSLVPRDPNLAGKLGIKPNAKVLVMAGYFGNLARSLARFCDVRYTDICRQMTDFVKRHPGKIRSLASRPAQALVRRPKIYDWSFLFEPIPVYGMHVVLVRSLLNKKGCKIVGTFPFALPYIEPIGEINWLYGTKSTSRRVSIKGIRPPLPSDKHSAKIESHPVDVLTLYTNAVARQKAWLDLRLLQKLSMAAKKGITLNADKLCKKFGVSKKQLEESRIRLNKISSGIPEKQNIV